MTAFDYQLEACYEKQKSPTVSLKLKKKDFYYPCSQREDCMTNQDQNLILKGWRVIKDTEGTNL